MLNTDQTIQAPTTNRIGLMATPAPACMLDGQNSAPRIKPDPTAPLALAEHITATKGPDGLDRLAAALPAIVDRAMQDTIPAKYTPELAAAIAEDVIARLTAASPNNTPCPDGIPWCDGDPANHTDTDDHRHTGPEHNLSGSYVQGGGWTDSLMGFQLAQWPDGQPHIVFQGSGAWPDLTMGQVDELIDDATGWLTQLIATRRRLAIELNPGRTPFTEPADKQTSSAAFDLATRAMDVALTKTGDQAGMLRALRNFLDLTEDEQA